MKKLVLAAALVAAFAAASPGAFAQMHGPAYGPGANPLARAGPRGAPGPFAGMYGSFHAEAAPWWSLLTPEEQRQHFERMRGLQGYEECLAYMTEHHALMRDRAAQRGLAWPAGDEGPFRACEYFRP